MTDSDRSFFAESLVRYRSTLDEINTELAANVLDSHAYIVTHLGHHVDIKVDGTKATSNNAPLLRCTRYTERDAQKIAKAFGNGWQAEHWRVVAERHTQLLQLSIAQFEDFLS